MERFKDFIIRKLGGYTITDLEQAIMEDRIGREIPRTIQFEISFNSKDSNEQNEKAKNILHKIAFEHLIRESRIFIVYNPRINVTNYFLTYDIPIKTIMKEIDYNAKENK